MSPPTIASSPGSKPANPNKHSLLTIPSEIRNHIFSYLVEYPECDKVHYRTIPDDEVAFYVEPHIFNPTNLFLSCRTIYLDAATIFYKNNTFELTMTFTLDRTHTSTSKAYPMWMDALGSQEKWASNVRSNARGPHLGGGKYWSTMGQGAD